RVGHHPVPPPVPAPRAIDHNDPPQGSRRAPRVEDMRVWTPETEDDVFEEVHDHHRRPAPRRGQHADFRRGHEPSMYMGDIEWDDTPVIEEEVYDPDPALIEAFHTDSEPIDEG
ncbi:hypothetical protein Taro_027932, partial [Colocasia esculenta]|nr:hypothetical protein [Colocasia esculenta]